MNDYLDERIPAFITSSTTTASPSHQSLHRELSDPHPSDMGSGGPQDSVDCGTTMAMNNLRLRVFDGGEFGDNGDLSFAGNKKAVKRLMKILKDRNADTPTHTSEQVEEAAKQVFKQSRSRTVCFWGWLITIAYAIIILSFAGVLFASIKLSQRTVVNDDDVMVAAGNGRPIRVSQHMSFTPLPLLWALPIEFFQEVPSVVLQLSPTDREMYRVDAVLRDSLHNITRFSLATGHQLLVTPDIGVLRLSPDKVLARWNFNSLWREMRDDYYRRAAAAGAGGSVGTSASSGNADIAEEQRLQHIEFETLLKELLEIYELTVGADDSARKDLQPAHNSGNPEEEGLGAVPVSGSVLVDDGAGAGGSVTDESVGRTTGSGTDNVGDESFVDISFPLLRGEINDRTEGTVGEIEGVVGFDVPAAGSESGGAASSRSSAGLRTPPSALSLPSSVISPAEVDQDGELILSGFPVPLVDEEEPIEFGNRSSPEETTAGGENGREGREPRRVDVRRAQRTTGGGDDGGLRGGESTEGGSRRVLLKTLDELFAFKMGVIGGTLMKTALKVDKLVGLGGAFLSPAVNWAMTNPVSSITAPLVVPFNYYASGGGGQFWGDGGPVSQPLLQPLYDGRHGMFGEGGGSSVLLGGR